MLSRQAAHQRRGANNRGEYRETARAIEPPPDVGSAIGRDARAGTGMVVATFLQLSGPATRPMLNEAIAGLTRGPGFSPPASASRGYTGRRLDFLSRYFYYPRISLRERTRPGLGIIEPCLPSPAKAPPSGPGWLHEIKHDVSVFWPGGTVRACG